MILKCFNIVINGGLVMFFKNIVKIAICLTIIFLGINATITCSSCADDLAFLRWIKHEFSLKEKIIVASDCLVQERNGLYKELVKRKESYLNRFFKNEEYYQGIDNITKAIQKIEKLREGLTYIKENVFDESENLKSDKDLLAINFSFLNRRDHLDLDNVSRNYIYRVVDRFLKRGDYQKREGDYQKREKAREEKMVLNEAVFAQEASSCSGTYPLCLRSKVSEYLGIPSPLNGESVIDKTVSFNEEDLARTMRYRQKMYR